MVGNTINGESQLIPRAVGDGLGAMVTHFLFTRAGFEIQIINRAVVTTRSIEGLGILGAGK